MPSLVEALARAQEQRERNEELPPIDRVSFALAAVHNAAGGTDESVAWLMRHEDQ